MAKRKVDGVIFKLNFADLKANGGLPEIHEAVKERSTPCQI